MVKEWGNGRAVNRPIKIIITIIMNMENYDITHISIKYSECGGWLLKTQECTIILNYTDCITFQSRGKTV